MVIAAVCNLCIPLCHAADKVQVVATLTVYGEIARELGGDRVKVESIASGRQDAHFVSAKPSFARLMADADLFLSTGMDLELWAPALIDKSRNAKIREGATGYVSCSQGMKFLEVPKNPNRAAGDIHIYGNPHIHTDPLRAVQIAANILIGLKKVDPEASDFYDRNYKAFEERIYEHLFGVELCRLVGGKQLAQLSWDGRLDEFLDANQYQGKALRGVLGGWMKQAEVLRGKSILAYHKNWIYLSDRFGFRIADYVEDKPGIPPSARHVVNLIDLVKREGIKVMIAANYYDPSAPQKIEEKTGAKAVIVPLYVEGTPEAVTYFDLVDIWVRDLTAVFKQ